MSSWGAEHYSISRLKQKKSENEFDSRAKKQSVAVEQYEPPKRVFIEEPLIPTPPRTKPTQIFPSKLKHIRYDTPTYTDTAVILVFFNPASCIRIQQNILYVVHQLEEASIPFFIGELVFNTEKPLFTESNTIFHFKSSSYMFYKENIINQVLQKPQVSAFTKFVILDADIVFAEPNWLDRVSTTLNDCDLLQPYETAYTLNRAFVPIVARDSVCKTPVTGHIGYAWAFRREWYDRVGGLFELAVIGGGDSCLAFMVGATNEINSVYRHALKQMAKDSTLGFLRVKIFHLPHGLINKRQLQTRIDNLETTMRNNRIYNLADAVERNDSGILEWKPEYRTIMNSLLLNYFKNREDDMLD